MNVPELQTQIEELQGQVSALQQENARLRALLAAGEPAATRTTPAAVTNASGTLSLEERVALFQSLFKGREDVFARRWYSKTSQKAGYQPVCANDGNYIVCNKHQYKCAECPNRRFAPLSYNHLYNHLAGKDELGRDVIGIYALLCDNTCNFVCTDFDDKSCEHGYQSDVTAFVRICHEWDIPYSIERSRSGKGAHVWIFFCQSVSAAKARHLGYTILSEAMNRSGRISFKSFDRFFPNQDQMPDGGFGNLVALPLQGLARKYGNSVFVDDNFQMYPDQWAYLQTVRRISPDALDELLQKHHATLELSSTSETEPWEQPTMDVPRPHTLPQRIRLVKSDKIYIPITNLPGKTINYLRRLSSFRNPDFYRRQAMRLPTFATQRIVSCTETTESEIAVPRGCEEAVQQYFESNKVAVEILDQTSDGHHLDAQFIGALRPEQAEAVEQLSKFNCGVLSATTAFGKTVAAIGLIARWQVNTLILVHTKALQDQWLERLNTFLDVHFTQEESTQKCGRKKKVTPFGTAESPFGRVDVATIQSCIGSDGEVKPLVNDYGMVIVDECHHVSAVSFEQVLKSVTARRVYGLTATPIRKDGLQPIIFMQCGPIRFTADASAQIRQQTFERHLITRFTSYRSLNTESVPFAQLNKELAEDANRNQLIVEDILASVNDGRTPIVLTTLKTHVIQLRELLSPHCPNVVTLLGSDSTKEKRCTMERLHAVPSDQPLIVIATGKYVGEGFDYPRLDTLFLALPVSWKGIIAQYAGRLHREYEGKKEVRIYDYVDIHDSMCNKMYHRRLKGYAEIGYQFMSQSEGLFSEVCETIFNKGNFEPAYLSSLSNATKSVFISTPSIKLGHTNLIVKKVVELSRRGVNVIVCTPEESAQSEYLQTQGINIRRCKNPITCTVIDKRQVWYGSINFLGHPADGENCIHLTDATVAAELIVKME